MPMKLKLGDVVMIDLDVPPHVHGGGCPLPSCCCALIQAHPERKDWSSPPKTREGLIADELYLLHQVEHHPERVQQFVSGGAESLTDMADALRLSISMRGGTPPPRPETP